MNFKLVRLKPSRTNKTNLWNQCAFKCLENLDCKGYLFLNQNNTCFNFENATYGNFYRKEV